MKKATTFRMIMVLCAMNMLLAQLMGLHFHHHMVAGSADHGTSLHLRDAGMHLHENSGDHNAAGDRAAHPDEDLEIDPLGAGLVKFAKVWLSAAVLFFAVLCLFAVMPAAPLRSLSFHPRHPQLFFLRPPSNAPPLEPSRA